MIIVLLGPPGAGKGTQADKLAKRLGIPKVATGDVLRAALREGTKRGLEAKSYMDRGDLVPDEVTIKMVEDRLQKPDGAQGAILDGFPRNLVQVTAFDAMIAPYGGVTLAPLISLEDDEAIRRITGRRVCRACGAVYHVDFNPPKKSGICDVDQGELYQRADDAPETVRNRLYVYYKQTAPLIGYYYAHSLLVELDGAQPIEDVQSKLKVLIDQALQR